MNAVERLWDALAVGDEERAAEELHGHVVVDWPHTGERLAGRPAYLAASARLRGSGEVRLHQVITEGRRVAIELALTGDGDAWVGAGIYHLHDGRIQHGVEYWLPGG